jgi:hypothetical protein
MEAEALHEAEQAAKKALTALRVEPRFPRIAAYDRLRPYFLADCKQYDRFRVVCIISISWYSVSGNPFTNVYELNKQETKITGGRFPSCTSGERVEIVSCA